MSPVPDEADADDTEPTRFTVVSMAVAVEGGLVLVALALGWMFDRHPLAHFALTFAGLGWGLVAAMPMLLGFLVMNQWPIGPLARIKKFTESTVRPFMRPCTRVDLLGISCLAGLGEEMFFRGWLQDLFAQAMPVNWAIVAGAVLFGLMHAITLTYAILAALIGIYLGWVYVATDNLLPAIVAHAVYDFVVLIIVMRGDE